jgi:ketosteroid isomerase-like protein
MSPGPERALATVETFLGCSQSRDWARAESVLHESIVRTGIDGSVTSGRSEYLGFLVGVLDDVRDYRADVARMVASGDGAVVLVQIHEELTEADGTHLEVTEAMVFDVDDDGLITSLTVYAKSDGAAAAPPGPLISRSS